MKKVLITGAAGFIGSHLTEYFLNKDFKVTAFDRYNSFSSFGWLDTLNLKKVKLVLGDIRDFDSVNNVVKGQDIVIHLAALIGIPYSYISPAAYIKTNIEGTYNILEASKNNKVKQVLITSTSETYGTAQTYKISENHPLNAQSPYAASKISADQMALSYYRSFKTPVKIIRPFNTFGPRQSLRAVIPTIIAQAINHNIIEIGNINTSRDLTFVTDTCDAFYKILKSDKLFGEVVNVGSDNDISIKDIIKKVSKILDKKIIIKKSFSRWRPIKSEVFRLRCDNKKILKYTNWKPKFSGKNGFDNALSQTIEWFKNNKQFIKEKKYYV
jgi:NAD dependent epimerase/dehydratase